MSRLPSRATGTALTLAVLCAAPLAACGAGQNANVKNERFAEGTYVTIDKLKLQNVQLHPLPGEDTIEGTAILTFSVFNDGQTTVRLTGISSDSGGQVEPGTPSGSASASTSTSESASTSASPSVSASTSASASPSASTSAGKKKRSPSPSASASASTSASPSASSTSPSASASESAAPARPLPVAIQPGGALVVGPTGTTQLVLTGLGQSVRIGRTLFLTFQFSPGGSSGRIPVPVTADQGTTASSTPTSESPTSYPADEIDPSWYETPFDDRRQSDPPEPPGK